MMVSQMSIWDEPDLAPDGEYVKFNAVGDAVAGKVTSVGLQRWDDGSISPKIGLLGDDGIERTLTAGQVRLKVALTEKRPEVGDHLSVRLSQIEPRGGGKTLKHFEVEVTRGEAGTQIRPATEASSKPPF